MRCEIDVSFMLKPTILRFSNPACKMWACVHHIEIVLQWFTSAMYEITPSLSLMDAQLQASSLTQQLTAEVSVGMSNASTNVCY